MKDKVKEFMEMSGDVTYNAELRKSLFNEEYQELKSAIKQNDRVEILDALVDMSYIAAGTAIHLDKVYPKYLKYETDEEKNVSSLISILNDIDRTAIWALWFLIRSTINSLGFSMKTFNEAFDRVHENNMSKFPDSELIAQQSVEKYMSDGIVSSWVKRGDRYVILRNDNKILKPINFKPVNLEDLV